MPAIAEGMIGMIGWIRVLAVSCFVLFAAGCSPGSFTIHGEALGTFYTITVASPPREVGEAQAREIAEGALSRVNALMSTYLDDSELSRFNRHADASPFPVSPETYSVFQMAQEIAVQSGGAFDITVGPLVNAWGFGPDEFKSPPTEERIRELLERTGYQKLELREGSTLSKKHPLLYCDLSAIAKGYAVDAVAADFEAAGISRYMIEVGGEIRVAGKSPKEQAWTLGIEKPVVGERELETVIHLESGGLATSGDYRNMYEVEGRLVSHTIDPHTGYPVQHTLASASVIHPSCARADGYATALMALGPEKALAFAKEHRLAVLLIIRDEARKSFRELATPEFDAFRSPR